MSFQPIVVTLTQAETELRNYIVRRQQIVHRGFDRRLQRLDTALGAPLIDATNRINEIINLLNRISAIAVAQRDFVTRHLRGTANRTSGIRPSTGRRRAGTGATETQTEIRSWMSREQVRHMLLCLLPFINHRVVTNVGNTTTMNADCTLNTDSFTEAAGIHRDNQLITTINANHPSHRAALGRYIERSQHVILLLNNFVSATGVNDTTENLARIFIQQQQERPTQNIDALINRIAATRELLTTRYRNILRNAATIEYARSHGYDPDPTIVVEQARVNNRVDNPSAVVINWNHPDLVPIKHLPNQRSIFRDPIDIFFAVALTRFLKFIKRELHVVEVYSDGFIRNPLGLDDPHPFGRSCDITGFGINSIPFPVAGATTTPRPYVLHLRRGYPRTNLRGGEHTRNTNLQDYSSGPSDWFNIAPINEIAYREELNSGVVVPPLARSLYLRSIINVMPRFFGFVKGPGSDNNHMDHFHIDLARFSESSPAINCPATILNPTPFIPQARPGGPARSSGQARPANRR